MERLEKKQRETVTIMSTARLTAKLALAGLSEMELETLSCEQLLEKWAEIVLAGKCVPVASKSTSSSEIEREGIQFEKAKFCSGDGR